MSSRAVVKTTIRGGAGREYIEIGQQRGGGGEDNMDSSPVASNGKDIRKTGKILNWLS